MASFSFERGEFEAVEIIKTKALKSQASNARTGTEGFLHQMRKQRVNPSSDGFFFQEVMMTFSRSATRIHQMLETTSFLGRGEHRETKLSSSFREWSF